MKFILKTPDNITGGILLFGAAMIIGIAELYLVRKALAYTDCNRGKRMP
jgi:hypothetical protein